MVVSGENGNGKDFAGMGGNANSKSRPCTRLYTVVHSMTTSFHVLRVTAATDWQLTAGALPMTNDRLHDYTLETNGSYRVPY